MSDLVQVLRLGGATSKDIESLYHYSRMQRSGRQSQTQRVALSNIPGWDEFVAEASIGGVAKNARRVTKQQCLDSVDAWWISDYPNTTAGYAKWARAANRPWALTVHRHTGKTVQQLIQDRLYPPPPESQWDDVSYRRALFDWSSSTSSTSRNSYRAWSVGQLAADQPVPSTKMLCDKWGSWENVLADNSISSKRMPSTKQSIVRNDWIKQDIRLRPALIQWRSEGYTNQQVATLLGVRPGTAFLWCRDIPWAQPGCIGFTHAQTADIHEILKQWRAQGVRRVDIAISLGITKTTATSWCKQAGATTLRKQDAAHPRAQEMAALCAQNLTATQIAGRLGIASRTVSHYCKMLGVTPRRTYAGVDLPRRSAGVTV